MMASFRARDGRSSPAPAIQSQHDPFVAGASTPGASHHRSSNFDTQLVVLGPHASPAQAKRALEAHLAETDRRMEEAGKLGTALLQQRKELTEQLKEVEKLETEGELSDDLRQRLAEIEKDYNDVARESARAFLPKQRVPSSEAASGSPFVPEGKGGRRSVSPSKFEAQATGSPTKFSVPNRKVRNQPANRIHDIEFAAEISTSLIAQVRNLQGLLAEKEEELKEVKNAKSKLEYEAEGFQQRVKTLDESEHRYKDENWSLETQVHDLLAKEREAQDREKKLNQALNLLQAEKTSIQRELDEVKLSHSKLSEEHATAIKHHDIELGTAKRNIVIADAERAALRRKIDDLTGQNQELAKAVSASQRARIIERESILGRNEEDLETARDGTTPEHSPPPSPVKGTPRHSMLESETLKTSLGHAQRTIQGLRNNVHREKTEKLELRRMLQEARDELEKLRHEPPVQNKRGRKPEPKPKESKKPLRLLGNLRTVRSEVFSEDSNWEDQPDSTSPTRSSLASRGSSKFESVAEEPSEQFETANETSDAAFETAQEPATETDDFHTGAEEFSSDDDDDVETETESPSKRLTPRNRPSSFSMGLTRSGSLHSTASTEDDDYPFDERSTPTILPPLQQKFPLRVSRGAWRRSRQPSEEPMFPSSPPSIASSTGGTPLQPIQSLAAELGDFDASDNESNLSATPSRRSIRGRTMSPSPPPPVPPLPRVIMVDSGTMTDNIGVFGADRPLSMGTVVSRFSTASYDSVAHDMNEKLSKFPSPPTSPPKRDFVFGPTLEFSGVHSQGVEPLPIPDTHAAKLAALQAEHEQTMKEISDEKAAAYTAALDELKSQHAEQLNQVQVEAGLAHTQALETLKSSHANEIKKSIAEVQAIHAQELEALRSSYADEVSKAVAETRSSYEQQLEALKSTHAEEISKVVAEANAAHAKELEVLKSNHTDEIGRTVTDAQNAHTQELEALKSAHAEEISKALAETRAAHAQELKDLQSTYAAQMTKAAADGQAAHGQELDALKASFAEQTSQKELESKAAHDAEIEALKSSHAEQMAIREAEIKATHTTELESLKAKHVDELNNLRNESEARHAAEIAALVAAHSSQVDQLKTELFNTHAQQVQTLQVEYAQQLDKARQESDTAHSEELEALKAAHSQQIEEVKNALLAAHAAELDSIKATHTKHIEDLKRDTDAQHAAEIAALIASHGKQIDSVKAESQATLSKELAALKEIHAQEIDKLNGQHAATRAQELEAFKAAIDKQIESSKTEGDAAHTQQIEALNAAHAEVLEAQKRDSEKSQLQALESLKATHERNIEVLKSEHAAARSKELDEIASNHLKELDALRREHEISQNEALEDLNAAHSQRLEELSQTHLQELADLRSEHESAKAKLVEDLTHSHSQELEDVRRDLESSKAAEISALTATHMKNLDSLKSELEAAESQKIQELADTHNKALEALRVDHEATQTQKLQELADAHSRELESVRRDADNAKSEALAALAANHAKEIESLKAEYGESQSQKIQELADKHSRDLENLRQESDNSKSEALAALTATHAIELEALRKAIEATHVQELEQVKASHVEAINALRAEHQSTLDSTVEALKNEHALELEELKKQRDIDQAEALDSLRTSHSLELAQLKSDADAALAREVEAIKADHASILESYKNDSLAEKEKLLADHAAELEALRRSFKVTPPTLEFSSMRSTETLPIEAPEPRTPKREAFIIPREDRPSKTPLSAIGLPGRKGDRAPTPEIAEDETRQSPSATPGPETPESQRPFKEMSTNTNVRPSQKLTAHTSDQSAQTTLTSDGLDRLLKHQTHLSQDSVTITTPRGEVIVTPFDEARSRQRVGEGSAISAPEAVPPRRPGSSASARGSTLNRPPLPANHKEAIEAARTNSSQGGKGTMGPPLLPASAYPKSSTSRPETPSNQRPMSPSSVRGTPTPRAGRASTPGHVDIHSPTRMPGRLHSRQSSVSSFASEIDTRFNIRGNMGMDAAAFGPNTDPRMIQAITQTMIGEYLWKYTRKTGRGEMSENRHRRYFWVHPYTRTLYWSDRDPSTAGRSELKAKSIPIEAVRIVGDDNPMPPGLHRKSLIIISPGRTVKFTCTTGQRHETWFNALSYLLLRTGNENQTDAEDVAGQITQEDVDEFNPQIHRRQANGNRSQVPPSLSSYNSRTTRNDSPSVEISMHIPTLTPTREREVARSGTLGRLSGYWKSSGINSTFSSLRSRTHIPQDSAIYEASEVPDSAEDLRQIIEEQDMASDRMENVRACCDGKHDVKNLDPHNHSHSHTHMHPGRSSTPTPKSTRRLRA
ncbi:hypothetical protein F5Y13DRAFT_205982 [Hypoxylon sp. FL1857]|nr:hypothetical protein F5Y13DRAFT_205982 [Hypoxylon sp. FL1857]